MRNIAFLAVLGLFAVPLHAQTPAPAKQAEASAPKTKTQLLGEEKDELKAQYELVLQKNKNSTVDQEADYTRLILENKFFSERAYGDLNLTRAALDKIGYENKLADERFKALTSPQSGELQKLMLDNKMSDEMSKKLLAEMSLQLAKLKLANDVQAERQREQLMVDAKEKNEIDLKLKRMDLKERELRLEKTLLESRMAQLDADLSMRGKKEEWKKEANTEPMYLDRPFGDGRLVISDRRITLNGPIVTHTANYVTSRIHYFNNISSAPIFIVIDSSPGGSVMAGYRILKAMKASRAPVTVVVKSFAASMAATITTLADKSYVYPNAIILHHQMSTMNWGNMTQLKEQLDLAREWEKRLMMPIAERMGVTMEDLRKKMYEKNSDGDWEEFGDKAVSYKWATSVVDNIEETGLVKNPDYEAETAGKRQLEEKLDENGRPYVTLPRLQPFDFYFIYNRDKYYR